MTTELSVGDGARYVDVRRLGAGAAGQVYRAIDRAGDRRAVALKVVSAREAARLAWEFSVLRSIAHPNVAAVVELARLPRGPLGEAAVALVQEYVEGEQAGLFAASPALDREGRLHFALRTGVRVAEALAAIHAHGLVHGDVKPPNIVVGAETKLVDLGLARRVGHHSSASGTPGYLAPELLVGQVTPAADLYALGVTLVSLLRGAGETDALPRSLTAIDALRKGPPAIPAWVPSSLQDLLRSLMAREVVERPSDALTVAGQLAALLRAQGEAIELSADAKVGGASKRARMAALSTLPVLGQDGALVELGAALRAHEPLVSVFGRAGSGRSRIVREAVHALQLKMLQDGAPVPPYVALRDIPSEPPLLTGVVHLVSEDEGDALRLHALAGAIRLAGGDATLVVEASAPVEGGKGIEVGPLGRQQVQELLRAAVGDSASTPGVVAEVGALTGGLGGRVCALAAGALAAGIALERPAAWAEIASAYLPTPASVPSEARALVDVLVLCGGAVPRAALRVGATQLADQLEVLTRAGMVYERAEDGALCLISREGGGGAGRDRMEQAALLIDEAALDLPARALMRLALDDEEQGHALALQALARLRGDGLSEHAAWFAGVARTRAKTPALHDALAVQQADAQRALGRYDDALASLAPLQQRPEATALAAEVLRLRGEQSAAEVSAEGLAQRDDAWAALGLAVGARSALDRGDLTRAVARAEQALAHPHVGHAAQVQAQEVVALGAAIRGESDAALAAAREGIEEASSPRERARAHTTLAYVFALQGRRGDSLAHYQLAAGLFDRAGEMHGAATARVSVGGAALDEGLFSIALPELRAGAVRLMALGRDEQVWRVLHNLATAEVQIGNPLRAEVALEEARQVAERCTSPEAHALLTSLGAEVALARGQLREARERVRESRVPQTLPAHVRAIALGRLIEVETTLELETGAEEHLAALDACCNNSTDVAMRAEAALATARVRLMQGQGAEARAQAEVARTLARDSGTFELRLRALLFAGRCAQERGDAQAAQRLLAEARGLLERAAAGLPADDLLRMRAAPAYEGAFATQPSTPSVSAPHGLPVLHHAKPFLSERRTEVLFEKVLDAAVQLAEVPCGYLLTMHEDGRVRVRAARGLDRSSLPRDRQALSNSIVSEVLGRGQPVATTDAMSDVRLSQAESVHALSLRSVAALPLVVDGVVRGALYLEDRLRPAVFDDALMARLADLCLLAAHAIESAQLLRRERRARRRLSVAQQRLAEQLESQAIELRGLRQERGEEGTRHGILGHNHALLKTLGLASRVARSNLPALIAGESGTGKELLARAIHTQSERAQGPFVAENCAAVPPGLLESTLFGHVRGAFTGADRSRRGLFELAHGGTLLLDEVGDMPPPMQVRLLRVLQEGEVLPVGAERPRKVDVRVLGATHRDLPEMVKRGEFREDLYYRLAVVTLSMPALRERADDIPELVANFAAQFAPDRRITIERDAMRLLCAHPWPGNIRQLENEMRRALLFADDRLSAAHLSPELLGDGEDPVAPLDLHGQIAALERRLVTEALQRTHGNQTRAAAMLGISRYGLLKMVKRLEVQVPS